jgi:malonyl CoA-acyl carrier protein transacylase
MLKSVRWLKAPTAAVVVAGQKERLSAAEAARKERLSAAEAAQIERLSAAETDQITMK